MMLHGEIHKIASSKLGRIWLAEEATLPKEDAIEKEVQITRLSTKLDRKLQGILKRLLSETIHFNGRSQVLNVGSR
jgi:hypothetical protein